MINKINSVKTRSRPARESVLGQETHCTKVRMNSHGFASEAWARTLKSAHAINKQLSGVRASVCLSFLLCEMDRVTTPNSEGGCGVWME